VLLETLVAVSALALAAPAAASAGSLFGSRADYGVGAGSGPTGLAIGDFKGNGCRDIAVTNFYSGNDIAVLMNECDGSGTFQSAVNYTVGTEPFGIAAGQFSGDGCTDLAVANDLSGTVSVLPNRCDGSGTFGTQQTYTVGGFAEYVAVGDFNGDGCADIAVSQSTVGGTGGLVSVLLNRCDGSGTFEAPQPYNVGDHPTELVVGDFNGDGCPDIATANSNDNDVSVLLNKCDGSGTFQAQSTYSVGNDPVSLAVGDFSGNGHLDLALSNFNDNDISLLLGNGDGTFQAQMTYSTGMPAGDTPSGVAVGDFNGDGHQDLVVADGAGSSVWVLPGNGDGTFQSPQMYSVGNEPVEIGVADFTGAGGPLDVATANFMGGTGGAGAGEGTVTVLLNRQDALARLTDLRTYVTGIGPALSFHVKVQAAINYYRAGDIADTCFTLSAVVNEAKAQNRKGLTSTQANTIITDVSHIRTMISC
jgi:hypothetical protein